MSLLIKALTKTISLQTAGERIFSLPHETAF
jgi:hypothetical protein